MTPWILALIIPICQSLESRKLAITYDSAPIPCSRTGECLEWQPVDFRVRAFFYDFGCDTHRFHWYFGDGSYVVTEEPRVTHRYTQPGIVVAKVHVCSRADCVAIDRAIAIRRPAYTLAVAPVSLPGVRAGAAFEAVAFSEGGETSWLFDFGDGTRFTSDVPRQMHVYERPGTYVVTIEAGGRVAQQTVVVSGRGRRATR